jgi:hypothetical protein
MVALINYAAQPAHLGDTSPDRTLTPPPHGLTEMKVQSRTCSRSSALALFYHVGGMARSNWPSDQSSSSCKEITIGIRGEKKKSGRGAHAGWAVSNAEVQRYQKEGLLPIQRPD